MTNITTFNTASGTVEIDQELLRGYLSEAFEHLDKAASAAELFKEVVEVVAETTKMKKATVSKYIKERYDAKTKATKELGELFTKLDEVVEGGYTS